VKNLKKIFWVLILITLILVLSAANMVHAVEVTATIQVKAGTVAYDSGKGEIFVVNSASSSISVLSDSSSTSVSPTPTVPEFSNVDLILVVLAVVVVILCAVALAVRKSTRTHSDSKQKKVEQKPL
jgi:uncharacterized membrane protein